MQGAARPSANAHVLSYVSNSIPLFDSTLSARRSVTAQSVLQLGLSGSVSFSPSLPFFLPLRVHFTIEICFAYCLLLPSPRCIFSCLRRHIPLRTDREHSSVETAENVLSFTLPSISLECSSDPVTDGSRCASSRAATGCRKCR
jgi:hypothetical protein